MKLNRRDLLALTAAAVAVGLVPAGANASGTVEEMLAEFGATGDMADAGITLTAPEIAENGNTVPITVDAPGAEAILLLATGNPTPGAATFKFGPAAGSQTASTRIRLAGTQDVVAVAKMADGSYARAVSNVKVTIGGCGG